MNTTTIYRPYDGQAFAERITDDAGIVWERRLLIDGPGRWYVVGATS